MSPSIAVARAFNALLALLLLGFSAFGLLNALAPLPAPNPSSKLPELLLFGGFAITAVAWLVSTFHPSKGSTWLISALAASSVWLNALAHLGTRDELGFAGASTFEWVRMAAGAFGVVALLALAVRAKRALGPAAVRPSST